jgi:hypothetical protein
MSDFMTRTARSVIPVDADRNFSEEPHIVQSRKVQAWPRENIPRPASSWQLTKHNAARDLGTERNDNYVLCLRMTPEVN